ncbi:MAG: radical SAM protein [Chloroflexi bacterium]|nr:radical SAM protein [Chloroflexota bacterium]
MNAAPRRIVVWRVTTRCNLDCAFCAYSRALGGARTDADPAAVRRFAALLGADGTTSGRDTLISFLGGEPLIWPPLGNLARACKHECGLRTGVTTNGTTLGAVDARQRLRDDMDEVTVSVDGLGAFHDHVRAAPGGFAAVRDGVTRLCGEIARAGAGPRVRVNTILMRGSVESFEGFCIEIASWGVAEVTFNALGGRDRPECYPANRLTADQVAQFAAVLPDIRTRMFASGLTVRGGEAYLARMFASARNETLPVADCEPGTEFLFIDEHGRVAPCHFTAESYGVPLAAIRTLGDLRALPARCAASGSMAARAALPPSTSAFSAAPGPTRRSRRRWHRPASSRSTSTPATGARPATGPPTSTPAIRRSTPAIHSRSSSCRACR